MLYVIPVSWIALWSGRRETLSVVMMGLLVTMLIVVRYAMAPGDESAFAGTNRLLAAGVIWATVLLAIFRKVQEEDWELRRTMSDVLQQFMRGKVKQE